MPPLLRNILALVIGFLAGSVVNMVIVVLGPMVIPWPDGVDLNDMDTFAENLKLLEPRNFIAPFTAHALGTLAGAWLAARVASCHKMKFALSLGVFFLLGGITMVVMYGGPTWFCVLDLVGAYLPMAWLGGRMAARAG